jgi:RNA polymerase sigma-54 factor
MLPKMLQAIEILQLSTQALVARIEKELEENPVLEVDEPKVEKEPEEFTSESSSSKAAEEGPDIFGLIQTRPETLQDHLMKQVGLLDLGPSELETLTFLIGSLDPNGHLPIQKAEVESILGESALFQEALEILHSLDPAGIGWPGPIEAMIAQIDPSWNDAALLRRLLEEELEDLAKNRHPKVAGRLGVTLDGLQHLIEKFRGLDPSPGRAFSCPDAPPIIPEVRVRWEDGAWQYYLDDTRIPPLRLRSEYEQMAKDATTEGGTKHFLRSRIQSAKDLIRAVEQRKETLGRVARAALERQLPFLEKGKAFLRPMKMQEVAEAVGIHLSTVSRAIANKYLETDWGIFALRDLFDGGRTVGGGDRGGDARISIQERVKKIISAEDAQNPLSDEAVVEALAKEGVHIARRTVAKYRSECNIPSRWRRKRH